MNRRRTGRLLRRLAIRDPDVRRSHRGLRPGVPACVREVAARTEQYWCPIRHGRRVRDPHANYPHFVDYGDAEGYRRELPDLRRALTAAARGASRHS